LTVKVDTFVLSLNCISGPHLVNFWTSLDLKKEEIMGYWVVLGFLVCIVSACDGRTVGETDWRWRKQYTDLIYSSSLHQKRSMRGV